MLSVKEKILLLMIKVQLGMANGHFITVVVLKKVQLKLLNHLDRKQLFQLAMTKKI